MAKDPAFLFYSSDFLSGISDLTMEERGQYITLLCLQHLKGSLSEKTICLSVGSVSVDVLKKFLRDADGNYFNQRLLDETEKRNKFTESRRNNGLGGGRPLKNSIKVPKKEAQWNDMLRFFNNSCLDCGCKFISPDRPTKDHIIPTSLGGIDDINNWQPLCRECNSSKCADHTTDFRLKFIDQIPEKYKTIWFCKNNHMEDVNVNENKDIIVKEKKPKNLILPFESEKFKNVWFKLIAEKKWRKKSETSLQASLIKLSKYPEADAIEMMMNSIAGEWQGLFELNKNSNNAKKQTNIESISSGNDKINEIIDFHRRREEDQRNGDTN